MLPPKPATSMLLNLSFVVFCNFSKIECMLALCGNVHLLHVHQYSDSMSFLDVCLLQAQTEYERRKNRNIDFLFQLKGVSAQQKYNDTSTPTIESQTELSSRTWGNATGAFQSFSPVDDPLSICRTSMNFKSQHVCLCARPLINSCS